jgi:FixJ family two-component response regulator
MTGLSGVCQSLVSIVSADAQFRRLVKELVESAGLQADTFSTLQALVDAEESQSHGCLVVHGEVNALSDPLQQRLLRRACAGRAGVLVTEQGNIRTAVQALKAGIQDIVQRPYRDEDLLKRIVQLDRDHALSASDQRED